MGAYINLQLHFLFFKVNILFVSNFDIIKSQGNHTFDFNKARAWTKYFRANRPFAFSDNSSKCTHNQYLSKFLVKSFAYNMDVT